MPLMCGSSKHAHTLLLESLLPADMSSMNFSILAVKTHDPFTVTSGSSSPRAGFLSLSSPYNLLPALAQTHWTPLLRGG